MRVLLASYEVYPLAKVGGLADVAGTLPKYLRRLGVDIQLVMPFHKSLKAEEIASTGFKVHTSHMKVDYVFDVFETLLPGSDIRVFLLKNDALIDSDDVYGGSDLAIQAMAFCDAVACFSETIEPDIIHANDWQTALIPAYMKAFYEESAVATLLSIHNLGYQGNYPAEYFEISGLPDVFFTENGLAENGELSFLKAGVIFSDAISTVSPNYSKEIQTDEYGWNLASHLRHRKNVLTGILNGIDYEGNNPETDKRLPANYTSKNPANKSICKKDLQKELGLPVREDIPLLGLVSRLVAQKGLDLIEKVSEELFKLNIQLVVLGTGDKHFESLFKEMSVKYPDKLAARLTFDADLAQRIYAGSDFFLMPSMYEPCGLGQMFAMRYGTIPIVRYTGGLKDTVNEYNDLFKRVNGFGFDNYRASSLLKAIKRATGFYGRPSWPKLVENAFSTDCSWDKSAEEYFNLYNLTAKREEAN